MASVVIPAFNEERGISSCLESLLADAEDGEFEIIVVCNGCTDQSAEVARNYLSRGVQVIETPVGSKCHAMNLGDEVATSYPRIYLDADIQLSSQAVRELSDLLSDESPYIVASPKPYVDVDSSSRLVKSFYTVWTQMPYFSDCPIGAGVFALSKRGRQRFNTFPELLSDDEFARLLAAPSERAQTPNSQFAITPPAAIGGVIKIFTRYYTGNLELRAKYPELQPNNDTPSGSSLLRIARHPRLWPHAPVYIGVVASARAGALLRYYSGSKVRWTRDQSTREIFGARDK